jgi:Spy/CpxP family protein refolding chaperone
MFNLLLIRRQAMNKSRLDLVVFGLLFAFAIISITPRRAAAAAQASSQTSAKPSSNPDAIENDDSLNLTQDQKDKIKSIREDAKKQKQDIEKDKTLTPDQQTKQIKDITKQTRAQVFAVLTPEQQKAWSAEQRERRMEKKAAKSSSN